MVEPCLVNGWKYDASNTQCRTQEQRRVGGSRCGSFPVQPPDNHCTSASQPDRPCDTLEHEYLLGLRIEIAEEQTEDAYTHMEYLSNRTCFFGGQGFLSEWHYHILDEYAAPGVHIGIMAGEREEDDHGGHKALYTYRQKMG